MSQPGVKICGLTRSEDVALAVDAGADLLGFVFAQSPRQISLDRALELLATIPGSVRRVGLFMDQPVEVVGRMVDALPLDCIQFHGREDNAFCRSFGMPFVKAVAMGVAQDIEQAQGEYPDAAALLLDSHELGQPGGTGRTFDWATAQRPSKGFWLAGGLTPGNVAQAVRAMRPQVVDVSSGVESAPGIKDDALVRAFIRAAKTAGREG